MAVRAPRDSGRPPSGAVRTRPAEPADIERQRTTWDRLGRPLQGLVWLLMAATVVLIFNGAETLVAHLFNVVLLFVFAAIIALLLTPLIDRLQRLRFFRSHRAVAVLAFYVAALGGLAGLLALVVPGLVDQGRQLPQLADKLQQNLSGRGIHLNLSSLKPSGGGLEPSTALGVLSSVVSTVADVVLIVVISIYLLIEGRALVATLRNLFPSHTRRFDFVTLATGATIGAYVRGQLLMCFLMGSYTALVLTVLGVHYAIVLGAAAFILELVPILGTVISMALTVIVALLQSPQLAALALVAGLLGHTLDAYVVGPRVNGRVTQLHPLVALAALLVGAEVGGVLGALFAVPVAAVANIFLGALYRSRQGQEAMSTAEDGSVHVGNLPRLGEEIGSVEEEGIAAEPVPHSVA